MKDVNDKVYKIIGSCIEVHRTLGPGYPVEFYKKALKIEMVSKGLSIEPDKEIKIVFKEEEVGNLVLDFLVNEKVIVEIRSEESLKDTEIQRVLRCLPLSGAAMGVLVNFGQAKIQYKRILPSQQQRHDNRKDNYRYTGREMGKTRGQNPLM